MANQVFDGNLQWHDFINPLGMGSFMFHKAKDIFSNPGTSDASPLENESFTDFYKRVSKSSSNPDSMFGKLNNFFTGNVDSLRDTYANWYNSMSSDRQAKADYEYDRMLRQTEYSDMIKSMEDAGLNPYVLLANGASSGGSQSVNSNPANYVNSKSSNSGGKAAFAAVVYAIARIAAAVILA